MFENLIAQDEVLRLLLRDIEGGSLPPALLFSGPPASGKLTAALELGRVLSCSLGEPRAAWNCACPSCQRHRALAHPDLVLMGGRSFPEEISVALKLLERCPGRASAYFFVRAVRKLEKRFDPALFEDEEGKLAKAAPLLREIEERLDAVSPERAQAASVMDGAIEAARETAKAARKLEGLVPDAPPVFQIRALERWARLAPLGNKKTAIIENAETMQESSRNALLKILEEPPDTINFILLSSRRNALIRTILSRVRTYVFPSRDAQGSAQVLERVFREPIAALEGAGPAAFSIEAYLSSHRPFPPSRARELARDLLGALLKERQTRGLALDPPLRGLASRASAESHELSALIQKTADESKDFGQKDEACSASFRTFLWALSEVLGELLREDSLGPEGSAWITESSRRIREASQKRESVNLSPGLLVETLAYSLVDA